MRKKVILIAILITLLGVSVFKIIALQSLSKEEKITLECVEDFRRMLERPDTLEIDDIYAFIDTSDDKRRTYFFTFLFCSVLDENNKKIEMTPMYNDGNFIGFYEDPLTGENASSDSRPYDVKAPIIWSKTIWDMYSMGYHESFDIEKVDINVKKIISHLK